MDEDKDLNNIEVEQSENSELSTLQTEKDQAEAGWKRAVADYQNLQKEISEQKREWAIMSERQILEEFIPVYDNFKKAFAHEIVAGENDDPELTKKWSGWKKGIEYIMKQFGDVLKNHQIEEIKTVGEMFDPSLHEIVGEEEVGGMKAHQIIREVDGGYKLGSRVIKVAKVVVASSK